MSTVLRQQYLFQLTNRYSFESVKDLETENVSTWGGLEPPTFGFMPNALTTWAIRATRLLSHVFEYWLCQYRYFLSKVNIWKVNCAKATAFIFDSQTDVLVKVSEDLETEKVLTWGGLEPPTFGFMPTWNKSYTAF